MGDSEDSSQSRQLSSSSSSSSSGRCKVGFVFSVLDYCSVPVHVGELLALVRGPGTAIRALNQHNTQVGLIDPDISRVLAPLVDSNTITIEGSVRSSRFPGPDCKVHIFACREELAESAKVAVLQAGLLLIKYVGRCPVFLGPEDINRIEADQRSLDAVFGVMEKKLREKAKKPLLALEPPKEVIRTDLLDHQKLGLAWLVRQENSEDLPPFWEAQKEGGDQGYTNLLTNLVTRNRPEPLRGGILADDMGLGKTLPLLSLIALDDKLDPREESEKPPAKEYFIPRGGGYSPNRKMTLVVCPPSVLSTWVSQLEEHTIPGKLKSHTYRGMEHNTVFQYEHLHELQNYDIILTTYSTLVRDERRYPGPLLMIKWWRIILDEAHLIKESRASHTISVMNLKAERRWAVTGTPMLDGSFDPFSLMEFLRYEPFSFKENWRYLMYRNGGLSRLKIVLATISLRRTKDEDLAVLPKKTVETCFIELSHEQRRLYDKTEAEAKNLLRSWGDAMLNYKTLTSMILHLRRICISAALLELIPSPHTIKDVSKKPKLMKKVVEALQDGGEATDCPICYSPPADMIITRCSHIFCQGCILNVIRSPNRRCPLCRRRLSERNLFSAPHRSIKNEDREPATRSSKVSTLVKLLKDSRDQNPAAKSVIYSQFAGTLVLLEEPLREAGFKTFRLGGSLKKQARVIGEFGSCKSTVVLLATLKLAGAAGIDLTAASTVYLMDTWGDPATEERAIGQVHRIGQTEEVRIVRMIARHSVEERMLHLQERKNRSVMMDFPGKDGSKSWQLDEYDIRMLFNLRNVF